MSKKISWSKEQLSYLWDHREDTLEMLSAALGFSTTTCRTKLIELGYVKGHRGNGSEVSWTQEMLDYLVDRFPKEAGCDIAEHLGISSTAVCRKAQSLGLKKGPDYDYRKYLKRYVKNYAHGNYVPYVKSDVV
jgi:hypothetical protein